jgi:hypothetical protein
MWPISAVAVCVVVDENQDNRARNQSANYKEHTVRQPVRVLAVHRSSAYGVRGCAAARSYERA